MLAAFKNIAVVIRKKGETVDNQIHISVWYLFCFAF